MGPEKSRKFATKIVVFVVFVGLLHVLVSVVGVLGECSWCSDCECQITCKSLQKDSKCQNFL